MDAEKFLEQYKDGQRRFKGVDLSGEDLRYENLEGIAIKDSDLSFTKLSGSNLHRAGLENVNFKDAELDGVNFDSSVARYCNFSWCDMVGITGPVNFQNCDLSYVRFKNADISKSRFVDSNLFHSFFQNVNASKTHFNTVNLSEVYALGSANLCEATFIEVDLSKVDLTGVDLETIGRFTDVNFQQAKGASVWQVGPVGLNDESLLVMNSGSDLKIYLGSKYIHSNKRPSLEREISKLLEEWSQKIGDKEAGKQILELRSLIGYAVEKVGGEIQEKVDDKPKDNISAECLACHQTWRGTEDNICQVIEYHRTVCNYAQPSFSVIDL